MSRTIVQISMILLLGLGASPLAAQVEQQETTDLLLSALGHLKGRIPEGAVLSSASDGRFGGTVPDPARLMSDIGRRAGYEVRDRKEMTVCKKGDTILTGAPALITLKAPENAGRDRRTVSVSWLSHFGGTRAHGRSVELILERSGQGWVVAEELPMMSQYMLCVGGKTPLG